MWAATTLLKNDNPDRTTRAKCWSLSLYSALVSVWILPCRPPRRIPRGRLPRHRLRTLSPSAVYLVDQTTTAKNPLLIERAQEATTTGRGRETAPRRRCSRSRLISHRHTCTRACRLPSWTADIYLGNLHHGTRGSSQTPTCTSLFQTVSIYILICLYFEQHGSALFYNIISHSGSA